MFDLGVTTDSKVSSSKLLVEKYLAEQGCGEWKGELSTSPLSSASARSGLPQQSPVLNNLLQVGSNEEDCRDCFQKRREDLLAMENHSDNRKRSVTKGRKPGRPPSLFVNVSDSELTEEEKKLKAKILKRRQRQNRSYQRKKLEKNLQKGKVTSLSQALEATSSVQVDTSTVPATGGNAQSPISVEYVGYPVYKDTCPTSSYVDEIEGYLSNSYSCTSSFEESSPMDDPLQQFLSQDMDTSSQVGYTRQSICAPSRLCTDSNRDCMLKNNVAEQRSTLVASVFSRLENTFQSLSVSAQEAWKAFSIFVDSFEVAAAFHIIGWAETERSQLSNVIEELEQASVLKVDLSQGRLQLYPVAKRFIMEYLHDLSGYHQQKLEIFKYRYLSYYSQWIQEHVNDSMFLRLGSCKQEALRLYHLDKSNIEHAFQLAKSLGWKTYRWFVVGAGCLLKYVWDIYTRMEQYTGLLESGDTQIKQLSESPSGTEPIYLEQGTCLFLDNRDWNMSLDSPLCMEESILLRMIAEVHFENKDWKNAYAYVSRCLRHMNQQGDSLCSQQCTNNEILCLYLLACIEKENGQYSAALSSIEKAKSRCIRNQLKHTAVWMQLDLLTANIDMTCGRLEQACITIHTVAEVVKSSNIDYDVVLLLELDALLETVLQLKGNGTYASHCLETIQKHSKCCYEWDVKSGCDYLLDYSIWSCLGNRLRNTACDDYHDALEKEDIVDSCYWLNNETSLGTLEEYDELEKGIG